MDAAAYLAETHEGVLHAVRGFTEEQWRYKPAPERWSAVEILEHLGVIAERVAQVLGRLDQARPAPAGRDTDSMDDFLVKTTVDRSHKIQAPPHIYPTGCLAPNEALEQFSAGHAAVVEHLKLGPALRRSAIPHPVLGPLDGHQWILVYGAHNVRHTAQIQELTCATCL